MSWVKKLFGKKEEALQELGLEDTPAWLEEISRQMDQELGSNASSIFSEIKISLSKIKKSVKSLEEVEPEGRFHLKMVKVAASNRDNMVKQVRMLIENIDIPKTTDVRSVISFHENAMQSLTVCLENMLRSYQYTKLVYIEESKQVIADVNALGRHLNRIIEPINEKKTVISALENARTAFNNIKKTHLDIENEKIYMAESEKKTSLLKKGIQEKQKTIGELQNSHAWNQYKKDRDELTKLKNDAKETESDISGLIVPLHKALTRLKQLDDSRRYTLKPELRDQLNLCLSDPKSADCGFFAEFEKIVRSDALELTPDKKERFIEQIIPVVSSFDSLKNKYRDTLLEIEKKNKQISGSKIIQEEIDMNNEINNLQDKDDLTEKEIESSKKRLSSLEVDIEKKKLELKQNMAIIDESVNFLF
jgi:hypothetical protein